MSNTAFFAELDRIKRELTLEMAQFQIELARKLLEDIIGGEGYGNPIDTGRSAASWVYSRGTPIFYVASDVSELNRISKEEAKARSMSTLVNLEGLQLGETFFLANGNKYVEGLELGTAAYGYSSQAPNGFILLALAQYEGRIAYSLNFPL